MWWNRETKEAVERKAQAFKLWGKCDRNDINRKLKLKREYDICNKRAKQAVAKAHAAALKDLYDGLEEVSMITAHRDRNQQLIKWAINI